MAFIYVDKSSRVNSTFYRNIKDFLLELWVICVGKYVSINPYSFFEAPITIFFSNIPKLILYFPDFFKSLLLGHIKLHGFYVYSIQHDIEYRVI